MLPQSTSPMRPSPLRQSWNPSQSSSSSLGSLQPESLTDSTPRLYIDGEGRASVKQHHLQQPQQQQHQGSVNHSGLPTLKASKSLLIDPSDAALTQLLGQNPFNNGHIPAPSQQLPSQTASFSHPPPPSKPHGTPHPSLTTPFPPTTQFFILDSAGNDPSGLATYTALPPHDDNLTVHPVTGERLYYLVAAPTVFRASESRLLPVGYKCGDTVKQKANVVGSRVVRRYVVGRERREFDYPPRNSFQFVFSVLMLGQSGCCRSKCCVSLCRDIH